jgi:DNA/RNA-binding domain of Phe-tRNA-synthetase-like protein
MNTTEQGSATGTAPSAEGQGGMVRGEVTSAAEEWLAAASIDPSVGALRPDYRALLIVAEGLLPGPGDAFSQELLAEAEAKASDPEQHPHIAEWREAFRAFGAKPKRTRPSVDALLRRAPEGLPRIDRLTDIYNAVSVTHVVPLGGEDLDHYTGPLRLTRAEGTEPFELMSAGEPVTENPRAGEVIWRDDQGVTCRRWNWRQCVRTRLTTATTRAVFILDALSAMEDPALEAAARALTDALHHISPEARTATRLLRAA